MGWLSHRQRRLLWRPEYIAYGASALFLSTVHNLFLLYHVPLYISHYKIDEVEFFWASLAFLVWNAVNDFLLGWMSDGALLSQLAPGTSAGTEAVAAATRASRLKGLSCGGPLMAGAFLLMLVRWPWVPTGLQFGVALCLYDGFLTWVDLSHSALLAELAAGSDERSTLSMLSSIFSASGSLSVFASFFFWDIDDIEPFRMFATVVAVGCSLGFVLCARIMRWSSAQLPQHSPNRLAAKITSTVNGDASAVELPMATFFYQVCSNSNLMWFTLLSLVQTFHCHFNSNFFPLILGVLLKDHISPFSQSLLLGLSFLLPHLNNVYFSTLVNRIGSYAVIKNLLWTKLALAVAMLVLGSETWLLLCIFVASNRVFTEGVCKLLNLVVSDLIDEDCVRNDRPTSISALIFGTTNLFTKPGQSLAPLLGTYYIARQAKGFIFSPSSVLVGQDADKLSLKDVSNSSAKEALFALVVAVPIFSALIQLVAWSRFNLHTGALENVRAQILKRRLAVPRRESRRAMDSEAKPSYERTR